MKEIHIIDQIPKNKKIKKNKNKRRVLAPVKKIETYGWSSEKSICPVCGGDGGAAGHCYKCGGSGWA